MKHIFEGISFEGLKIKGEFNIWSGGMLVIGLLLLLIVFLRKRKEEKNKKKEEEKIKS